MIVGTAQMSPVDGTRMLGCGKGRRVRHPGNTESHQWNGSKFRTMTTTAQRTAAAKSLSKPIHVGICAHRFPSRNDSPKNPSMRQDQAPPDHPRRSHKERHRHLRKGFRNHKSRVQRTVQHFWEGRNHSASTPLVGFPNAGSSAKP